MNKWHDFIRFLNEEGIYKEYLNEFNKYCLKCSVPIQTHIEFLKNRSDDLFVALSFHWDMTNNKAVFWSDIDLKWKLYRDEKGLA